MSCIFAPHGRRKSGSPAKSKNVDACASTPVIRPLPVLIGPLTRTTPSVGSLNGTYLNRELVEEAPLRDGDELQIGTFKLVFLGGRR